MTTRTVLMLLALLTFGCRTQPGDADGGGLLADGGGLPAGNDDGVYEATLLPTGLNRLQIFKLSRMRDLCFNLVLASPQQPGAFGVTLPMTWKVESAWVTRPASRCGAFTPPAGALAVGRDGLRFFPCSERPAVC